MPATATPARTLLPPDAGRIKRGMEILARGRVRPHGEGGFAVHSVVQPTVWYYVWPGANCTCEDHLMRFITCKHMVAVGMVGLVLGALEREKKPVPLTRPATAGRARAG